MLTSRKSFLGKKKTENPSKLIFFLQIEILQNPYNGCDKLR